LGAFIGMNIYITVYWYLNAFDLVSQYDGFKLERIFNPQVTLTLPPIMHIYTYTYIIYVYIYIHLFNPQILRTLQSSATLNQSTKHHQSVKALPVTDNIPADTAIVGKNHFDSQFS
jgi:hypothetical protein